MTDLEKGMGAFNNKEYKTALDILHPLAEQGDVNAQLAVGKIFEEGLGIPQHYTEAYSWYQRAYKQGETLAVIKMGLINYQGLLGLESNHAVAKNIFQHAARKGIPEAQYYLALMYERAEGGDVNLAEAHMLYNLAASNGHEEAAIARDRVAKNMEPREIMEAQENAAFVFQNPPKQ